MGNFYVHYTQLNVINKILQKDGIRFLASRFNSMNDPFDCKFATDIVLPEAISVVKERYGKDVDDIPLFPYVISFSKKKDDFNMWRLYNSDVSLVFNFNVQDDFEKIADQNIEWHGDCVYLNRNEVRAYVIKEFEKVKENLLFDENSILDMIRLICFKIKERSYENEGERRLISCDAFTAKAKYNPASADKCDIIDCEIPVDVGVRSIQDGRIKFYKEINLKKSYLQEIILKTYDKKTFDQQKRDIELLLANNNYEEIEITQTQTYPCIQ